MESQRERARRRPRVTAVIPAYNEQANIRHAVGTMRSMVQVDHVVVVDGYSEDDTRRVAREAGAQVLLQARKAYPGKGIAIQTAVDQVETDIFVFFDADIRNMTPEMVTDLLRPVLSGEADHAIATYRRKGGRVTELTVRPLLKLLFPEVTVRQPLAGEFAVRRKVLDGIELEADWGLESGLVVDLFMQGHRVVEVDLGNKEHDMKGLDELHVMAVQAARTVLEKAAFYGRLDRIQKKQKFHVYPEVVPVRS